MTINIEKYNPEWKTQFEQLRVYLMSHFTTGVLSIEHVGSTSVPGMWAKPIIDLDIVIENNYEALELVIEQLESIEYTALRRYGNFW